MRISDLENRANKLINNLSERDWETDWGNEQTFKFEQALREAKDCENCDECKEKRFVKIAEEASYLANLVKTGEISSKEWLITVDDALFDAHFACPKRQRETDSED